MRGALLKLTVSNLVTRKMRVALTVLAIAFSVSLVVGVTTGYKSIEGAAFKFLNTFLGAVDAQVTFEGQGGTGRVPESLLKEIEQDPAVGNVVGRLESEVNLADRRRRTEVKGIRRPEDREVEKLKMYEGEWFEAGDGEVCVIDQVTAKDLGVKVGGTVEVPAVDKKLALKVVGIIHKPEFLANQMRSVYVPIETLQTFLFPDDPRRLSRIMISFKPRTDVDAFAARWRGRIETLDPQLKLSLAKDRRQELAQKLEGLSTLSLMAGAVSMLAATFIVFSTLSMGVTERQRTLAMLRAIGAFRAQLGWLVVMEGLLLALVGIGVGVPLGWMWVRLLAWRFDDLFSAGVIVDWRGVGFGVAGSLAAALAASFIPAWQAMRTSPLEAMTPLAAQGAGKWPWRSALAGLLLASIDPFISVGGLEWVLQLMGAELTGWVRSFKFYAHFIIGLPTLMGGFFLLAPMFVWVLDRLLSPLIAAMLGLRLALVRQQVSTAVWRAAGTCAALMVGLSVLVVMQIEGHSMIDAWQLPTKFPDLFIASPLKPLNQEEWTRVAQTEGVKELMPLAVASPSFGTTGFIALAGAAMIPDATMFFGMDPDKAFDMMQLDFTEGSPEEARAMLKKGRHIIVTDEFRTAKGLHVGDKMSFKAAGGPVDYTIAGVVWSPGLDVIVGLYDLDKQFGQRTMATVFGTLDDAARDFRADGASFLVANLAIGLEREELVKRVQERVKVFGLAAYDVRQVKYNIQKGLGNLLLLITVIPLAALAVASLGVTNTILASIRTRSWQFGILRSIGVTRSQLLRLVAAEAVLIGLVGVALGIAAGAVLTMDARGLYASTIGFVPPIVVPWRIITAGVAAVMFVAVVASIIPAIGVSRRSPLALLQAGRAAV